MDEANRTAKKVSVIVCTFNGEARIADALGTLTEQTCPRDAFEVLVIDNDSEDGTHRVCGQFMGKASGMSMRCCLEKNRGLSHARNRGIREARGGLLAFIDDDALADPRWVEEIIRAFDDPAVHALGGKVLPRYRAEAPPWLSPELARMLSILDLGDGTIPFAYPRTGPCGTNMAFRREVFDAVGPFDPRLGRTGKRLVSAEETDVQIRMERQGMAFVYSPGCVVHHVVPAARMTRSFMRRRCYHQGLSVALVASKHASAPRVLLRDLVRLFKGGAPDRAGPPSRKGLFHYELKAILYGAYLLGLARFGLIARPAADRPAVHDRATGDDRRNGDDRPAGRDAGR